VSDGTAAHQLEGLVLPGGWEVIRKLPRRSSRTGGAFSVGYEVQGSNGARGYCKALDFADALDADDPPTALSEMVDAYNFERDLLLRCGDRKLRRVVSVLHAGTVRVEGARPNAVSFLVLELADGDANHLLEEADISDCVVGLRAAHHAAVGLNQLHSIGVSHQDVKPSNLLVWRGSELWEGKVGDLGAAHDRFTDSPYDGFVVPGDPAYAAPECLYRGNPTALPGWRQAVDMYMYGNLLAYLLSGVPLAALQLTKYLDRSLHWKRFTGTFEEALPYIVDAHGATIRRITAALHEEAAEKIGNFLFELCHPDPDRRGDAVARRVGQNPYTLQRYITRLDLLMRRVELKRTAFDGR
jgi:eukaryotic-like serine/threonine-protein kinase